MTRESLPDGGLTMSDADQTRVVVAPAWTDPRTGQTFVHRDLVPVTPDWTREDHIGPTSRNEKFGDVESWASYVTRYADQSALLTWCSRGLSAVLDYPTDLETPGRCQWTAVHPFTLSAEWRAWAAFASGSALSQRQAIEKLEDLGEDITEPAQADLTKLLRDLRANATAQAETEIRPDGTTAITFSKDTKVSGRAGAAELPALIRVAIPVLAGDATRYEVRVRMRVSVDDNAHLTFRFSLVNAERVLEAVYEERVSGARALLGDERQLLRADG